MKIAVVTATGLTGASARYRAVQYVEQLAREHTVELLLPSDGIREARGGAPDRLRFFAHHARCYTVRLRELRRVLPRFDGVLVQRGAYPMGPGAVVDPIVRFGGRVVFDLDDAVFMTSPNLTGRSAATRWLYGPQQASRLVRRADAVVVSTAAVGASLPAGSEAAAILPTIPDPAQYAPVVHAERRPARIGWVGNAGNLAFLDPIAPALDALRRRGLAELEVVSSRRWSGDAAFVRWTLEHETDVFGRHDIGIMPLPDTPYTRAKAGFKLLQCLAAGLPVVASPVGANVEIVTRSGAGMLASTPAEWEQALGHLAEDVELRARLGRLGREWIEQTADIAAQAAVLGRLLAGTHGGDAR